MLIVSSLLPARERVPGCLKLECWFALASFFSFPTSDVNSFAGGKAR
jgi:hypothetical protein